MANEARVPAVITGYLGRNSVMTKLVCQEDIKFLSFPLEPTGTKKSVIRVKERGPKEKRTVPGQTRRTRVWNTFRNVIDPILFWDGWFMLCDEVF